MSRAAKTTISRHFVVLCLVFATRVFTPSPLAAAAAAAEAPALDIRGQASSWLSANDSPAWTLGFGLRYIPALACSRGLSPSLTLDAEASANASLSGSARRGATRDTAARLKLYRAWLRLSSARFEARLGLQKINFGSASLLRPLMWFDRVDPRDPLQVTDGVTGLLVRYYFPGNANAWAWALYGNDDPKGWEASPTARRTAELGGRLQVPLFRGELGLTYHSRRADLGRGLAAAAGPSGPLVPEDRWALDGKWDVGVGIGLWAEGALVHQRHDAHPAPFQRFLTVGADTTLPLGGGIHILVEHLNLSTAAGPWERGKIHDFTAATASLPLGLLDRLWGIIFYDWRACKTYNFVSWQRTYDNWQVHLIGFWNSETGGITPVAAGNNAYAGKGLMLMVVFNH